MNIAIGTILDITDVINCFFSRVGGIWQVDRGQKPARGASQPSHSASFISFREAEDIGIPSIVIWN